MACLRNRGHRGIEATEQAVRAQVSKKRARSGHAEAEGWVLRICATGLTRASGLEDNTAMRYSRNSKARMIKS